MRYPVQIEQQNGHYHASVLTVPTLTQTAATRAEVLRLIQEALLEHVKHTEIVYVDVSPIAAPPIPADHSAGSLTDEPPPEQDEEQEKMQQEVAAYHELHQDLWQNFPGQYVAVYQGQVVDHDGEQLALYLRIRQRYPGKVVLIRQVRPEVEKSWTMRTPKFEHR